ncbi:MAG: S8 family serine peptidase, partial [Candidatus Krumholzibacteriia bacterium]
MSLHHRLTALLLLILCALPLLAARPASASTAPRQFAPVQGGFDPTGTAVAPCAPGRLLVKFTADALRASTLNISARKGAAQQGTTIGLASVDAIGRSAGLARISRPYEPAANAALATRIGLDRWYLLEVSTKADIPELAARYAADPAVEAASPDWVAFPAAVPTDPLYAMHWGHNNTAQLLSYDWTTNTHEAGTPVGTVGFDANAQAAWDGTQGYGDPAVVVAIIDSGVDIDHPDLRIVTGYDFGDGDTNPDDNSAAPGHGTCCAGVVASKVNNGLGTAGIAAACAIMPLKVADSAGSMYFTAIQSALRYAADNGAEVASMSLGAAISSDAATDDAILYAYSAGVVILAATGNENASAISYPAINANVIGVGAASPCGERKRSSSLSTEVNSGVYTDPNGYTCDGERWWGSNYGVTTRDAAGAVDVIAPTILPTTDIAGSGGYVAGDYELWFNGTSCATPYAAGVCALIKSKNPTWTPAQIRAQLVGTAQDVVSVESVAGWDRYAGYGMVDAAAAVGAGVPVTNTVTVTAPNGGEVLTAGAAYTVTWTSTGTIANVKIDYSADGGSTWSAVVASTANDGSQAWTVPTTATTTGRIRVADAAVTTTYDISNANFTIQAAAAYATLPYSTGFETGALDQYWTKKSSTTAGRVLVTTANTPHTGSYHMTMDCSTSGTYVQNEAWLRLNLTGQTQVGLSIWWKDIGDETQTQDGIYFSNNGGTSFVKVYNLDGAATTNNVWYQLNLDLDALAATAGLALNSTFVVKIQQYDNYPITTDGMAFDDISVTAVTANTLTVTAPNGGETLAGGASTNITWTSTGTIANVKLDYSIDAGTTWTTIIASTPNDGTQAWTVPYSATTQARVRVSDAADATTYDTSNANFTITAPAGTYATLPYSTGFETGALDQYWTKQSSTTAGRVLVTTANTPHTGSYHMTMDCSTSGTYVQNEAWLRLNLTGQTQV